MLYQNCCIPPHFKDIYPREISAANGNNQLQEEIEERFKKGDGNAFAQTYQGLLHLLTCLTKYSKYLTEDTYIAPCKAGLIENSHVFLGI